MKGRNCPRPPGRQSSYSCNMGLLPWILRAQRSMAYFHFKSQPTSIHGWLRAPPGVPHFHCEWKGLQSGGFSGKSTENYLHVSAYQAEVYVRPMRLGLTLMCGKRSLWSQTFVFAYNAAQSKPHFRTVVGSIRHRCESGKQEDEVSISIFPENWADTTSDPMTDLCSGSHPASHSVQDPKTRAGKPQLRQQFHRDNPRSR